MTETEELMIEFTQYLRPDGRTRKIYIQRPESIVQKARIIQAKGYRFECEELMTGMVSLTISNGQEDVAGELCQNGPGIAEAVDRMITQWASIQPA